MKLKTFIIDFRSILLIILILSLFCLLSCAPRKVNVENMIPIIDNISDNQIISIKEVEVSGANLPQGSNRTIYVSNDDFKKAIYDTFKKENIDSEKVNSLIKLYAIVKEQKSSFIQGKFNYIFIAEYNLIDINSDETIWTETYLSEYTAANIFLSLEGAVRINIASLLERLKIAKDIDSGGKGIDSNI